jgi:hypothetical protein
MNIVKQYPPNITEIMKVFPINKNTVFTYGDTLYAPNVNFKLPPDLLAHEQTHTIQQGADPAGWWDKYLKDKDFRLQQEIEAYRNQYRFFCKFVKGRNERFNFLRTIAMDLSGSLYGNLIGFIDATSAIKS